MSRKTHELSMTVYGKKIGRNALDATIKRMERGPFSSKTIETTLFYADGNTGGFIDPKGIWMQAADRLIQKERKVGNIVFIKSARIWCPTKMHVLVHRNDEAGKILFSIESADDVGNWIDSFSTRDAAEAFITQYGWEYNAESDYRGNKTLFLKGIKQ